MHVNSCNVFSHALLFLNNFGLPGINSMSRVLSKLECLCAFTTRGNLLNIYGYRQQ